MATPVPGQVPGYILRDTVGRGTTATVWRGEAVGAPGRIVAIKHVEVATDRASIAAVQREAEVLDRLSHPSVLRVLDVVRTADGAALVTPYASGGSLASALARTSGGLPAGEVADLGARLASALAATHTAGVVHRDVKPANVLFDAEGQPLLGDFGTALLTGEDVQVTGTAEYLDPTVVAGRAPDASSDLYALGVTLYEALAGVPPYAGSTPRQTLTAADRGRHVRLRDIVDAPESLTTAIESAMARQPDARPRGAHELAARLDEARREIEREGDDADWHRDATSMPPTRTTPPADDPPSADGPGQRDGSPAGPGSAPPVGPPTPPPTSPSRSPDQAETSTPPPDRSSAWADGPTASGPWGTAASNAPSSPGTGQSGGGVWPAPGGSWAGPTLPTTGGTDDDGRSGTIRYGPAAPRKRGAPPPAPDGSRFPRWALVLAAVAVVLIPAGIVAAIVLGGDGTSTAAREPAPECDDVTTPVTDGTTLLADVEGRGCSVPIAWDGEQLAVPSSDGGIDRYDLGAEPDDVLLFGDWNCDGRESPSLYRPGDGRIFTFDALVGAGEQASVTGDASGVVGGEPRVRADEEGCHRIEVAEADEEPDPDD